MLLNGRFVLHEHILHAVGDVYSRRTVDAMIRMEYRLWASSTAELDGPRDNLVELAMTSVAVLARGRGGWQA